MDSHAEIGRFALYGETGGTIAPEFVHIEPISARSSLYEWTISAHAHPGIHQLLLVERGGGVLHTDGHQAPLGLPALVAVPSGCVHAFAFARGAEGWVLSLAVDLLHDPRIAAPGGLAMFGRAAAMARLAPDKAARLSALLGWLADDLATGGVASLPNPLAAQVALILVSADAALGTTAPSSASASRRAGLADAFRRLVDQHFRDGWGVDRYAAHLGTTGPTLTRACRAELGRAPAELVGDRQLLEAMRYLTYSAASVQQIAGNLGFADPAYFARFFKRRTGMTASHFRESGAWLARQE